MKDKVVVDTSCWIEYFNHPESKEGKEVERLILEDRVVITGCIIAELLQGAKRKKELEILESSLSTLPYLEETIHTWRNVGRLAFEFRNKGITIPLTDCLIATLAQEKDYSIFTLDSHFKHIPKARLYKK